MVTMSQDPHSHLNDSELKRRKQTLERAKANHLSRQLQMRLQYARLKVEHGWQRQNLNEVENLYFHHSQRTPRSSIPEKHSWITTTTAPSILPPTLKQPSSRFEEVIEPRQKLREDQIPGFHAFTLDTVPIDPVLMSNQSANSLQGVTTENLIHRSDPPQAVLMPSPPDPTSMMMWTNEQDDMGTVAQGSAGGPLLSFDMPDLPHEADPARSVGSSTSFQGFANSPGDNMATMFTSAGTLSAKSATSKSPQAQPTLPLAPSPFHFNDVPRAEILECAAAPRSTVPAQVAKEPSRGSHRPPNKGNSTSATAGNSTPTQSSFGFTNSSLTYDSFWSSHSSSYRNNSLGSTANGGRGPGSPFDSAHNASSAARSEQNNSAGSRA